MNACRSTSTCDRHLKLSTPLSILTFADILVSADRFASRSNSDLVELNIGASLVGSHMGIVLNMRDRLP